MCREHRKHPTLVVLRQMKEAVPGKNGIELALKIEPTHISDDPLSFRQSPLGNRDQIW
jgi:hypothetical protein